MKATEKILVDRTQNKGNRLEYAYITSDAYSSYPLLGSVIRALGKKNWKVLVLAPKEEQSVFLQLKATLKNPDRLTVLSFDQLSKINDQSFELVLSQYADPKLNQQIRNHLQILGKSHVMTVDSSPSFEEYDLISSFEVQELHPQGVVAITGTKTSGGKGKTTTALGMAVEKLAEGNTVAIVQWFKEKNTGELTWAINEHYFADQLVVPERFAIYPTGAGFVGSPNMDRVAEENEHREKAWAGVQLAKELILSREYSTIVLDEFVDCLSEVMPMLPYPLLELKVVQELLQLAADSGIQVIVTGRKITPEWERFVKTSITISEVKHPWSTRKAGAVSGLDF